MAFPKPPNLSRTKINDAGDTLRTVSIGSKEYAESVAIVNAWRAGHGYPINTFKSSLRRKTYLFADPILAQRLKRLPTIIDKLKRYPDMSLARMQDIGGVRAIVNSISEVRKLERYYTNTSKFPHPVINHKDYITQPKNDGYRCIHLVFKYSNDRPAGKSYNGLLVEMQIRTKLQHTWATAVETVGMFREEALKSGNGSKY